MPWRVVFGFSRAQARYATTRAVKLARSSALAGVRLISPRDETRTVKWILGTPRGRARESETRNSSAVRDSLGGTRADLHDVQSPLSAAVRAPTIAAPDDVIHGSGLSPVRMAKASPGW